MLANPQGEEPVSEAKPYDIPKRLVWEAYQRVKADRGAAGVDGVTLAAFEQNLKGNLYKVWNRMSSGSYHPPPVRLVEIPKDTGGTRPLGIPTISDRVAQTVAKMVLEPLVEPQFHAGFLWLSTRPSALDAVGVARETLLEDRLGHRSGYQVLSWMLFHSAPRFMRLVSRGCISSVSFCLL